MNGRIASSIVEIATFSEIWESEVNTISIDQPIKAAKFEERRWLYLTTIPISWFLTLWVMAKKGLYRLCGKSSPGINAFLFDGLGLSCRQIKEGAASWRALHIIYNYHFGLSETCAIIKKRGLLRGIYKIIRKFVDDFWIGMINAQAVRNRLKVVKQELRRAIVQFSNHDEVRLLSLAAGSAQGIIEVIAEAKNRGIKVRAMLVDFDPTALAYAQKLSDEYNVADRIKTVESNISQIHRFAQDFKPQIIEMLGLLDYIPEDRAIRFISSKIREILEPGGIFLTCNINKNPEMHFLKWVINWSMIYRTPAELSKIIETAGFQDYRLVYEPLKIHGLAIAHKT